MQRKKTSEILWDMCKLFQMFLPQTAKQYSVHSDEVVLHSLLQTIFNNVLIFLYVIFSTCQHRLENDVEK